MLRRDLKRKRAREALGANVMAVYKVPARAQKRRRFVPGVDRTGGFYGRYSGRDSELKFHDVTIAAAGISGAGIINSSTNNIAQGVTESTRVGRKCVIKSFNWRYSVNLPGQGEVAAPVSGDSLRIIVYIDKQCNGTAAAVLDILETASLHSFRNMANSGRFVFIMDKLHSLSYQNMASESATNISMSQVIRNFTFYKKLNVPIEFNNVANDGSLATIRSSNIGALLISQTSIIGLSSVVRLRFSDG